MGKLADMAVSRDDVQEFSGRFMFAFAKVTKMTEVLDGMVGSWKEDSLPALVFPTGEYEAFLGAVRALVPYGIDTEVFYEVETDARKLRGGCFGRFRGIYPVRVSKDAAEISVADSGRL